MSATDSSAERVSDTSTDGIEDSMLLRLLHCRILRCTPGFLSVTTTD